MTRTLKMMIAVTAVLCLTVGVLTGPALALGEIDTSEDGSVTVSAPADFRDDLAESTVAVNVYKLASVDENALFTLEEPFASLAENEQWNGGLLGADTRLQDLADAAVELIQPAPAEGEEQPEEPAEPRIAPNFTAEVPVANGVVELPNVGLYLLLPQEVQTELWVYTFNSMLLSVPSIERTGEDTQDGEWLYDVAATLKPERVPRLTDLVIDKTLQQYNVTLGPTTFLFDVEATRDGELLYSNVVSLTFSGAGTQSVTVSGIPVGAHVTVTEVYSGASYEAVDGKVSVEVEYLPLPDEAAGAQRVGFTNDYDDHRTPDASVVNTFVFNGTGWQWQSNSEEAGQ